MRSSLNEKSNESLAVGVVRLLAESGKTVVVAESSTGGLIGHRLTEVAGSSAVFLGGVIAYNDQVKEQLLHLPRGVLEREGAVSAESAKAMADGVRRLLDADIGISATGIAGPTGATPGKPLGLTFVALASATDLLCERFLWSDSRPENNEASAEAALRLLQRYLERH